MSYVLGFFAADGCMIRNKRGACFIEFQITDKDILLKIRKLLGSNHKISKRRDVDNWKSRHRLQIGSKEYFNDLSRLGLTQRKSQTIRFPNVPKRYFADFVRGYFDGDGNVYIYNRKDRSSPAILSGFTCGNKIYLKKLKDRLKSETGLIGGTLYRHSSSGVYRLYYSTNDSAKLYGFMYCDKYDKLHLSRKKKVFEKFLKIKSMDR